MMKNMQWRLGLIAIVIGLSVWAFYPPDSKVKLGLDLKGGVHLVLRVKTDDALKVETDTTVERLRDTLTRASVTFSKIEATSPTEFRADGITDDAAFRTQAADAETVYDRSSETGGYSYRMKPNVANQLRDETVTQALETIERRVNELGVAEPIVARYGARDQILVQLPGVSDVRRAKEIIRSTAQLQLRLVDQGPFPSKEAALQAFNNALPADSELMPGKQEGSGAAGTAGSVYYVVKKVSAVAGNDLRNAQQSLDEFNRPAVHFTLKQDAAVRFGSFTEANIGRPMAIILDGRVMSVATIQGRITDSGQITGITREEMLDQVITLKSGALPASMDYLEERTVGPSLGQDSIRAGVTASLAGLALVVVFMIFYYKLTGLNAIVSIVVNLLILLGLMAAIPGHHDASRCRRVHPDDRYGRRFERADLRADQRGTGHRAWCSSGGERRLRPRVVDDRRHARLVAHRGTAAVAVRHRPDSRVRRHAHHRTSVQRVHRRLRVAHDVRSGAVAPATGADTEYLRWKSFTTPITTSSGGGGTPSRCRSSWSSRGRRSW